MPFDDTNPRDPVPEPPPPKREATWDEKLVLLVLAILAVAALLLPLTAASFVDLGRALTGR